MSGYRLVTRVADAFAGPSPGAIQDYCARCQWPAWVDVIQEVTPEQATWPPVCTRCVLADPELLARGPEDLAHNIRRLHYWADRMRAIGI